MKEILGGGEALEQQESVHKHLMLLLISQLEAPKAERLGNLFSTLMGII